MPEKKRGWLKWRYENYNNKKKNGRKWKNRYSSTPIDRTQHSTRHICIITLYIYCITYVFVFGNLTRNETKKKKRNKKKDIELTNRRLNRKYIIYLSKSAENWCYPRLDGGTIILILIVNNRLFIE